MKKCELIVVIVIIGILITVSCIALNPLQRMQQATNATRSSDVNTIQTAIQQYIIDQKGEIPEGITEMEKQLGTCTSGGNKDCPNAQEECLDLSTVLGAYLKTIPQDPRGGTAAETKYSVVIHENTITVKACGAEGGKKIELSR